MKEETAELLAARFGELPLALQTYIRHPAWPEALRQIGTTYNVAPEKMTRLENVTLMALLAFLPREHYEESIIKELLIPGSVAMSISREVHDKIFKEVDDELNTVIETQKAADAAQAAVPKEAAPTPTPSGSSIPQLAPRQGGIPLSGERPLYGTPPTAPSSPYPQATPRPAAPMPPPQPKPVPPPIPAQTPAPSNPAQRTDPYREQI